MDEIEQRAFVRYHNPVWPALLLVVALLVAGTTWHASAPATRALHVLALAIMGFTVVMIAVNVVALRRAGVWSLWRRELGIRRRSG